MSSPWRVLASAHCPSHTAALSKADTDLEEKYYGDRKNKCKGFGKKLYLVESDDLSS